MHEARKKNKNSVFLSTSGKEICPGPEGGVEVALGAPSPLFLPAGFKTSGGEKGARWAPKGEVGKDRFGVSLVGCQGTFSLCLCLSVSLSPSQSLASILNN